MAVLGPFSSVNMNGHNNIHSQLTKSLERILEDAFLSGELKLSGRKLKEFPKPVKFDLSDTVVADLSKNRFTELPDELTTYMFLEKLLLSQNVIRNVPDAVGSLQSLTYLDLSSNQLTDLPREICQMPLQVLLVNDNLLTSLPKELGRMGTLAELDASHNRLTQIPMTLGDCAGLRALHLSDNQLGLLPLQITYLRLEHLDISCNCISSLPLELRNMSTLVTLELDNNPLVSPPTTVCMRGRVHIFKYLENMANKDLPAHKRVEDTRRATKHNSFLGATSQGLSHQPAGNATIDCLRHRQRHAVDSGYSTDGVDKRWSNDGGGGDTGGGSGRSTPSTPSTLSPGAALSRAQSLSSESPLHQPLTPLLSGLRISPEGNLSNGDDKSKLAHQQTYRQYKEALRQQRQQDVYRPRTEQSSPEVDTPPTQSPAHLPAHSPHSPLPGYTTSPLLHSTPRRAHSQNGNVDDTQNKRPVQKVVPSRNNKYPSPINGNYPNGRVNGDSYTKPTSPTKSPTNAGYRNGDAKLLTTSVCYLKGAGPRPTGKLSWSKEASDALSFTMKREFDKQKEESELLAQLRVIIESRLKMQLPANLAPVLADGVVLCHLANHVRPRAVGSVHVPSPAQPKLTMARCRRNVDNFLEACRRIGVEEEAVCAPEDILDQHPEAERERTIEPLARTVTALLAHAMPPRPPKDFNQSDAFYEYDDQSERFASDFVQNTYQSNQYCNRYSEERHISSFNHTQDSNYYTIDESEEYQMNLDNNNSNTQNVSYSPVYGTLRNRGPYYHRNRVGFVTPFCKEDAVLKSDSLEIYDTDEVDFTQPTENREAMERYDRARMSLDIQSNLNKDLDDVIEANKTIDEDNRKLFTCLCLGTFLVSALVLYLFPL